MCILKMPEGIPPPNEEGLVFCINAEHLTALIRCLVADLAFQDGFLLTHTRPRLVLRFDQTPQGTILFSTKDARFYIADQIGIGTFTNIRPVQCEFDQELSKNDKSG